ncbi:hypothetical protein LSH36_649g01030 [Paralvinella palmiformis]|uniref:Bcl-2 Bcl-2 homology region 1-3 domain-containing protein n=1 Tax=Paralvinella palmiformis TaxID=53620 RepID=A0AAD9J3E2_9ANNE|nr:hypothetical protein LSH36_649g01030 [Paralvinella palmiformis]
MTECCQNGIVMTAVNTRVLVSDYMRHHLKKHNVPWEADNGGELPGPVELTMRAIGDEFEDRYREVFEEMSNQLHISPSNARQTFHGVVNELFNDEVNWGRIVALFSFGATLAVQCVQKDMPELVDQLVDWITQYLDDNLYSWIQEHNGWVSIISL